VHCDEDFLLYATVFFADRKEHLLKGSVVNEKLEHILVTNAEELHYSDGESPYLFLLCFKEPCRLLRKD